MAGWTPISPWRLLGATKTAFTGTAASSPVAGSQTRAVLVRVTADAHIRIGQSPQTAIATDTLIRSSDPPLIFACSPGDLVSAVQDSAGGNLFVTELTH